MKSVRCLFALMVVLAVLMPRLAAAHGGQALSAAPPLALATALHMSGSPVVGDQSEGVERPWYIWAAPNVQQAKAILSVGPHGAGGSFDYFDTEGDPYATHAVGAPLPVARAKQVARTWLRRLAVHLTQPIVHVAHGRSSTVLGGTVLCCWKGSLDVVQFGGTVDSSGAPVVKDGAVLYIDSGGQVVQANIRRPAPDCESKTRHDSRGALVGRMCFDYHDVTETMWTAILGGHHPYQVGPGWFAQEAAFQERLASAPVAVHLKRHPSAANTAVYTATNGKATYRYVQVKAFPKLKPSIWPLVRVQRVN